MKLISFTYLKIVKAIGLIFVFVCFFSCDSDKKVIEQDYSLIVNDSTQNNEESLAEITEFLTRNQSIEKLDATEKKELVLNVDVHEEISNLFAPDSQLPCKLPKKIINKIRKTKNWTPRVVRRNLSKIPKVGDKVPNISALTYLNSLSIVPVNGNAYEIEINSSPKLEMINFIDRGRTRFAYSLDCSGYLNAALEFNAGASAAKIKSSASSSLTDNGTVLLVRANVIPPVVEAVRKSLPASNRMNEIDAFTLILGLKKELRSDSMDEDKLVVNKIVDLLWTSNEGKSSFNGEASLSGGVRFIGIQFSADAGGSLTRSSSFTNFDTYILNKEVRPLADPITVGEINSILVGLAKSSRVVEEPKNVNGDITFELLMPSDLSGGGWTVKGVPNANVATEENGENKVKFTISNLPSGLSTITISRDFRGLLLEKSIKI